MYEECNGAEKYYFYDSNGVISGIRYFDVNGTMTMIYVVTNALGDVIALYDKNGNAVVKYEYDAWGNIISTTDANGGALNSLAQKWSDINPFRYRGYYYDSETGLYYLQSRYYDAETGSFLNADVILDNRALSGINPFTYCGNNPVVRIDSSGTFLDFLWDVVSFACSVKEVIENPTDLGAWGGAILDGVDILVPCVGGLGEVYDVCRAIDKVDDAHDAYKAIDTVDDVYDVVKAVDGFNDLSRAAEFGIKPYNSLRKVLKGTGLEAHHIIEQRLVKHLNINLNTMLSVAVTPAEHQFFTNEWRKHIAYGTNYTILKKEEIWGFAQIVYKDYPELLRASRYILFS